MRSVWLFEFGMSSEPALVSVANDRQIAAELFAQCTRSGSDDISETVVGYTLNEAPNDVSLERLRSRVLAIHPREFEFVVKQAFDAAGYTDVAVTRYSQDGGIAVIASFGQSGWPVRGWQVQVQAKRWLHTVGRKEVAELRGSLSHHGLGCLIATSHFSKAAVGEATEAGKSPITLLNGRDFAGLLTNLGIGVDPPPSS